MSDLRERLAEAQLVSHLHMMDDGYPSMIVHSEADAVERATAAVAEWLREEAAALRALRDAGHATTVHEVWEKLDSLADSLTRKEPTR